MAEVDNWYLALELPFDPVPERDLAVIDARIAEKVRFWSQNATDSANGSKYTLWREKAQQMKADLRDAAIRQRMADEAVELVYGKLDANLRQASANASKPIDTTYVQRIAKVRGFPEEVVQRRAKAIGITVSEAEKENPAEYQATFSQFYTTKPPKYGLYEGFKADLATAGADDLYEFIRRAGPAVGQQFLEAQDPRDLVTATLRDTGAKLKSTYVRKTATAEKIMGTVGRYCESVFADDTTRREYDTYLAYLKRRNHINEITQEITEYHRKRCSRAVGDGYILGLVPFAGDKQTASSWFVALCKVKGFDFDVDADGAESLGNKEVCRCGNINTSGANGRNCTRCGRELLQHCPKCGRDSPNTHDFCSCGFDFLNVIRAGTACGEARAALERFDLDAAKESLAQARSLYPAHAEILGVTAAVEALDRAIGNQLAAINRHVRDLNYQHAKDALALARLNYPKFNRPGLAKLIDEKLAQAVAKRTAAEVATDASEVLSLCKDAYALCRDLPGLPELVARYTSLPLDALSVNEAAARNVSVAQVNHKIVVRMDVPGEGETGIRVAYRFDAFPSGPEDDQAICREFPLVELTQEGVLRLEPAQQRSYYVAVFLRFEAGGRSFYSKGEYAKLELGSRTVLTYSLVKRRFSQKLSIELESNQASGNLPELALVYSVGHAPVFEASAQQLFTIPSQPVSYPCTFEVPLPASLPKNTYVKPFVHDDGLCTLKLATNSTNRVT